MIQYSSTVQSMKSHYMMSTEYIYIYQDISTNHDTCVTISRILIYAIVKHSNGESMNEVVIHI